MAYSSTIAKYLPLILRGLLATVWLSLLGVLSGTIFGGAIALIQQSRFKILRAIASIWVNLIRSVPLLLLLFLAYYLPPLLTGYDPSRFLVAWTCLTLYTSSYASEIIRSGLAAVPKLQREAGLALGLTHWKVMKLVVFPQALRIMLPAYMGLFTVVIKDSSLVAVIGYIDLTRATRIVVDITYEPFPFYILALALYFILCYPIATLSRTLERRIRAA